METYPLIHATGLHKSFSQMHAPVRASVHAVNSVNLDVSAGQIYGLVGPDGAGKTTLTRLICGALKMDAGRVILDGFDIATHNDEALEHIGYLAQRFSLYEELTVMENLKFFAEVRGIAAQEWQPRSREILHFVGLLEYSDRRAGRLSGGMKQKLGLALALVNRPRILLLDEPTTGVDPVTRQDFWKLIIRLLQEEEMAVLVSTPYMDEAARCTRVGFLRNGSIICEGTPQQLRSHIAGRILELCGEPQPLLYRLAQAEPHVRAIQRFGNRLHLRVEREHVSDTMEHLKAGIISSGGTVFDLKEIEPQLEDVFIALSEGIE